MSKARSASSMLRFVWPALTTFVLMACGKPVLAQLKAFPQAEGYGENARGGRGGDVYHVTKLTDDGTVGTLRYGLNNAPAAGRTIVFDVGGWITLGSKLGVTRDNITIAGHTAPGGGIGVKGNQTSVGADNIVIRHMRFRPGKAVGRVDSLSISSGHDVIFDHVSAAFSYDENASANALVRGGVSNLTMQHSTVSFGLEDHSAGSLIQNTSSMTYHHNLYAHNHTRNPKARVEGDGIDWVNNVVYDYNNGFIAGDSTTSDFFWKANVDGNYFITGPGDTGRPMVASGAVQNYGLYFGTNAFDNDGDTAHDGALYTGNGVDASGLAGVVSGTYTWSPTRYGTKQVWQDATPQAAYTRVLSQFGATPWNRDEVDSLIHSNVVNRTGALITRESDLVGISNGGFGTLAAGVAPTDTDRDGIPDGWEVKRGTNPLAASNNGDFDLDGYTDLEEYLNDLAAFAAPGALEFQGIGRFADSKRWTRQWQPSRLDAARVTTGAAFVDAVGQEALSVTVGDAPGASARLYLTSGWLEVGDRVVVGGQGFGRIDHHGGELRVGGNGVHVERGLYRLVGGRLQTPSLTKSSEGAFEFSGGVLSAGTIGFDLVIQGGVLEVGGAGAGFSTVQGDLTLQSGGLAVQVASPTSADALLVTGDAAVAGVLDVTTLGAYAPVVGQSWPLLGATTLTGAFDSVTPGFRVERVGQVFWLHFDGPLGTPVPEPAGAAIIAPLLALASLRSRRVAAPAVLALLAAAGSAPAASIMASADTQLSENGATGLGDAVATGSGSSDSLNARWNFSLTPANRNEWIALKFDLSSLDPARLANVALRTTMFRAGVNNTQSLRLYALTPGTAGEDWSESTTTYATMPGFTFDGFSTTNVLNLGGVLQSLGVVSVSGVEAEGAVARIAPATLTSLVRGMGENNLLTLLISYDTSANGQWRIASREATTTTTGVATGPAGSLAARLEFDVTTTGVLGDYNDDGLVNAADYTAWRDAAPTAALPNEEVSPTVTDLADYLFWAERYGATDSGEPATGLSVPEPTAAVVLLFIVSAALPGRGCAGRGR